MATRRPRSHVLRVGAIRRRGMTLVEILIVMVVIALLTGTMLYGSGYFGGMQQRMAASLIVSAVRKGLSVANATGKPTRLAIDFASARVQLEQSASVLVIPKSKALTEEEEKRYAEEVAKKAILDSEQLVSGLRKHRPSFIPIDALGRDGELPGRALGTRVTVRLVQTEHDEEPILEGVGYLYFWPGGVTERAVVQLGEGDAEGLSVVVSPLTGRARIERGRVPFPEGKFGEDFSEREE